LVLMASMFKMSDLMADGLRKRSEYDSATKIRVDKRAIDRSRLQSELDLDRHKLAFLKEHERLDAEEIEDRKQRMIKTDRGLKYSVMGKIPTAPSKLHDMCFLGKLDEVTKLMEEQNANMNGVTSDLETCLDIARKGKELMNKGGHKKTEKIDHDGVVSYLAQRGALTYGEVVVERKKLVEAEMAKDKRWDKIKALLAIASIVLFVILLYFIVPKRRTDHEEHIEL